MPPITETKAALRARIRRQAGSLSPEERAASDRALAKGFLALPQVRQAQRLLLFYGVGSEPATAALFDTLWGMGKELCLPNCLPDRGLEARLMDPERPLSPGAYGIPVPGGDCPGVPLDTIDLILVPALCYDREGARLGQGGGYYDRLLSRCAAFTVGLCRDILLQDRLPTQPHDRPVELVLTETRRFGKGDGPRTVR